MKPSDIYRISPMSSVLQNSESETIARNIAIILKRTGDEFRKIEWKEYLLERQKDEPSFTGAAGFGGEDERYYFDKVSKHFVSEDTVRLFSPAWDI